MAGTLAGGVRWVLLSNLLARVAQPLFAILLARVLTPADFGLIAVVMVVMTLVALFQDMGLKQALVQRQGADDRLASTVFWLALALGIGWFLLLFVCAPWIGGLFHQPEMVPLVRLMAVQFLITPFGLVQEARLLKELAFKRLFWAEGLAVMLPGATALWLAYGGYGPWALAIGLLSGIAIRTGSLWWMVPWRPGPMSGRGELLRLFRFGGWVSAEAGLGWLIMYADQAFAGRFLGAGQVGLFRMGFALALLPVTAISQALGQVLFPAFSRHQDNLPEVARGFATCLRLISLLSVPVGVMIWQFVDPVLVWLLGAKWAPSVPVVQVLAVAGVMASLVALAPPLYRAIGRVDIMPRFFLVRAAVSVPAYWYGAQAGIVALAQVHLALVLLFAPINLYIATRVFGMPITAVFDALAWPVALSAVAAGCSALVGGMSDNPSALLWAGQMLVFLGVYGIGLFVFARQRLNELLAVIGRVAGLNRPAAAETDHTSPRATDSDGMGNP